MQERAVHGSGTVSLVGRNNSVQKRSGRILSKHFGDSSIHGAKLISACHSTGWLAVFQLWPTAKPKTSFDSQAVWRWLIAGLLSFSLSPSPSPHVNTFPRWTRDARQSRRHPVMDVLAAQNTPLSFPANKAHCKCELFEILERQRRLPAVQSSPLTHRNPFHLPPRPFFLSRRSPPRHQLSPTRPKSASSPNLPFLLPPSLSLSLFLFLSTSIDFLGPSGKEGKSLRSNVETSWWQHIYYYTAKVVPADNLTCLVLNEQRNNTISATAAKKTTESDGFAVATWNGNEPPSLSLLVINSFASFRMRDWREVEKSSHPPLSSVSHEAYCVSFESLSNTKNGLWTIFRSFRRDSTREEEKLLRDSSSSEMLK